ncbi:response regulator transcription factor [Nocardioides nanhaiensis]|uniref:Response regulator transcription factor n=1 Tax=Nocardioides nanhaiensis TaxID=1476871 RepID=A0ABP8VXW1_9ACTN
MLLVDDHPLVRAGLAGLIASTADDIEVVGQAQDGAEAVRLGTTGDREPDVVLMDLSMPGTGGVEATRQLFAAGFGGAVVVLTSFSEAAQVTEALSAGAVGYLLKDSEPDAVLGAIRSAAAGHAPLDPRVARALLPGASDHGSAPASPVGHARGDAAAVLSGREREVLDLVAQGLANKQVARRLGITERTVKVHLTNVYRRIGVGDRTSAALWARDHLPRQPDR